MDMSMNSFSGETREIASIPQCQRIDSIAWNCWGMDGWNL